MKYWQPQITIGIALMCLGCNPGTIRTINADELDNRYNLRNVYFEKDTSTTPARVSRLSVQLISAQGERKVRLDYPFKSQDKIRFKIESNRDGWIYVMTRQANNKLRLLWPDKKVDPQTAPDAHRVGSNTTVLVPPPPGKFRFDNITGDELFYVVIQSQRQPPQLTPIKSTPQRLREKKATPPPKNSKTTFLQIGLRSINGDLPRTMVYDPGTLDNDPNLYFTTESKQVDDMTIFEFRLRHEE